MKYVTFWFDVISPYAYLAFEPKRAWTFRHVAWLAHQHGVTLQTPAQHPFNPLALLRLATACAPAALN